MIEFLDFSKTAHPKCHGHVSPERLPSLQHVLCCMSFVVHPLCVRLDPCEIDEAQIFFVRKFRRRVESHQSRLTSGFHFLVLLMTKVSSQQWRFVGFCHVHLMRKTAVDATQDHIYMSQIPSRQCLQLSNSLKRAFSACLITSYRSSLSWHASSSCYHFRGTSGVGTSAQLPWLCGFVSAISTSSSIQSCGGATPKIWHLGGARSVSHLVLSVCFDHVSHVVMELQV